jgi:hypothetical protein
MEERAAARRLPPLTQFTVLEFVAKSSSSVMSCWWRNSRAACFWDADLRKNEGCRRGGGKGKRLRECPLQQHRQREQPQCTARCVSTHMSHIQSSKMMQAPGDSLSYSASKVIWELRGNTAGKDTTEAMPQRKEWSQ